MAGSYRTGTRDLPKFRLSIAPHSPFGVRLVRTQSGRRLPLVSPHGRVVVVPAVPRNGLTASGNPPATVSRYLFTLALSAVLPVPNTSQDAPSRGVMSFQFGTLVMAAKLRAPMNWTGPRFCSGTSALRWSYRIPRFAVTRFRVYCSCTKIPKFRLRFSVAISGVVNWVTEVGTPFTRFSLVS